MYKQDKYGDVGKKKWYEQGCILLDSVKSVVESLLLHFCHDCSNRFLAWLEFFQKSEQQCLVCDCVPAA